MIEEDDTRLEIGGIVFTGWTFWAVAVVIWATQALIWISFGALLAHEMCKP